MNTTETLCVEGARRDQVQKGTWMLNEPAAWTAFLIVLAVTVLIVGGKR